MSVFLSGLPTVKCSDCGAQVGIADMGDHVCDSSPPPAPPPPASPKPAPVAAAHVAAPASTPAPAPAPIAMPAAMPSNPPRYPTPRIDPVAASESARPTALVSLWLCSLECAPPGFANQPPPDRPFLRPDSPASLPPRMGSPALSAVSAPSAEPPAWPSKPPMSPGAAAMASRIMQNPLRSNSSPLARRPPSDDGLTNLDSAFPPFPRSNTLATMRARRHDYSRAQRKPSSATSSSAKSLNRKLSVVDARIEPASPEAPSVSADLRMHGLVDNSAAPPPLATSPEQLSARPQFTASPQLSASPVQMSATLPGPFSHPEVSSPPPSVPSPGHPSSVVEEPGPLLPRAPRLPPQSPLAHHPQLSYSSEHDQTISALVRDLGLNDRPAGRHGPGASGSSVATHRSSRRTASSASTPSHSHSRQPTLDNGQSVKSSELSRTFAFNHSPLESPLTVTFSDDVHDPPKDSIPRGSAFNHSPLESPVSANFPPELLDHANGHASPWETAVVSPLASLASPFSWTHQPSPLAQSFERPAAADAPTYTAYRPRPDSPISLEPPPLKPPPLNAAPVEKPPPLRPSADKPPSRFKKSSLDKPLPPVEARPSKSPPKLDPITPVPYPVSDSSALPPGLSALVQDRPLTPGTAGTPGTRRSRGICRGCQTPILGKSVSSADGRLTGRYHKACFVCQACRTPFPTADFYVLDDLPYCGQHYHERNGSLCAGCRKGIEGQYLDTEEPIEPVSAPGPGPGPDRRGRPVFKKFHPTCFRCHTCGVVLRGDYLTFGGQVYCDPHARQAAQTATVGSFGSGLPSPSARDRSRSPRSPLMPPPSSPLSPSPRTPSPLSPSWSPAGSMYSPPNVGPGAPMPLSPRHPPPPMPGGGYGPGYGPGYGYRFGGPVGARPQSPGFGPPPPGSPYSDGRPHTPSGPGSAPWLGRFPMPPSGVPGFGRPPPPPKSPGPGPGYGPGLGVPDDGMNDGGLRWLRPDMGPARFPERRRTRLMMI